VSDTPLSQSERRSPESPGVRVLLVDDDETWAESTAQILEHQHTQFSVDVATGLDAAREAVTTEVDCIVCDYDLEQATGLDLLTELRADGDDRPFLLITGQGNESVASEAIGERVTDYIPKRSLGGQSDLLARRIRSVVDTYRARNALARERRSKDAMLDILRTGSSQEGLFQRFCEHLHAEHDYACVWIGTPGESVGVVPRAVAGDGGYLDEVLNPDAELDDETEPALVALSEEEPYAIENIGQTGVTEEWPDAASETGFASAVATPIVHGGTTFGVLAVYDSTPGVGTDERTLLEEYGETIGYALRAAGWKESLLSASPVAVKFEFTADSVPLVKIGRRVPEDARIEVLTQVLNDETVLYVLRLTGVSEAEFETWIPTLENVEEARVMNSSDPLRSEVTVSRTTPETIIADAGGQIAGTVVENETATVTVFVSQHEAISSLRERLETTYPNVRMQSVCGAEFSRQHRGSERLLESLTAKQRQALEVAYFSGYFERPRDHNTTDVAAKLDISRQTLTQHLRAGERKLLAELFERTESNHKQ
jgi:predicted DNA binding protein/CheY-like chemotaxis protein